MLVNSAAHNYLLMKKQIIPYQILNHPTFTTGFMHTWGQLPQISNHSCLLLRYCLHQKHDLTFKRPRIQITCTEQVPEMQLNYIKLNQTAFLAPEEPTPDAGSFHLGSATFTFSKQLRASLPLPAGSSRQHTPPAYPSLTAQYMYI